MERKVGKKATPDDHPGARPYGCMQVTRPRRIGGGSWRPGVGGRGVPPARPKGARPVVAAPDDHLAAGPNQRVSGPEKRRVDARDGPPFVRRRVVTPGGVAEDDHLRSGPDGRT